MKTRRKRSHQSAELYREHMEREKRIFGPSKPHAPRCTDRTPPRHPGQKPLIWGSKDRRAEP